MRLSRAAIAVRASLRRYPSLPPLLLIVVFVWVAWYVGIRTKDRPGIGHSLGLVAAVRGDRGTRGRNLPAPARCGACKGATHIMRYDSRAGLRFDMVISVHPKLLPAPSCGNASVDLVISATRAFWVEHNRLGPGVRTRIALGWDRFTRVSLPAGVSPAGSTMTASPALVSFLGDPQAPLHPGFFTNGDLQAQNKASFKPPRRLLVEPFPASHPLGLRTQIADWDGSEYAMHVHFVANWVEPRGFGSCYVLIPSLVANSALAGTENALAALRHTRSAYFRNSAMPLIAPPSLGRIALDAAGQLSLTETSPPPTDFEAVFVGTHGSTSERSSEQASLSGGRLGPVWACEPSDDLSYLADRAPPSNVPSAGSFTGNACGAVAVVDAPGASDFRAVVLVVFGVLIALAFEWLIRRRRRRADE